ncbi:hypothetical protein [Nitrosomonas sp. Is79A3]|uniref:hypothetical protein n=1 Tax=Nitrosomonas sp. (strain Is79A3) TaxID=261292 RepID=UPI0032995E6E
MAVAPVGIGAIDPAEVTGSIGARACCRIPDIGKAAEVTAGGGIGAVADMSHGWQRGHANEQQCIFECIFHERPTK